jgi:Glycosyl hydrolases family 31/Domain of unknown function (DUF5110)/NPCBM-associated, NEW3 domain of alpha-galactosidase/Carbohydrate binding module (family 6)/IPT/TIG domain
MKIGHKIVAVGAGVMLAAAGLGSAATAQSLAASTARLGPSAAVSGTSKPCAGVPTTTTTEQATSPCSPVNLATPVNFGNGYASNGATVTAGDVRFEVLSSGLIRLEYSPSGHFENVPTVNVLDRKFAVPRYRVSASGGWLAITTSAMTLRYKLKSGPFTKSNTSFTYEGATGGTKTATPDWTWECPFGQVCDAGAAALAGGASLTANHANYQSTAGFIQNLNQASNASATWAVLNAPAGSATLTLRYANYVGALGGPAPRTIDVTVNGSDVKTITLPATASWDDWTTVTTPVTLTSGTNDVGVLCGTSDSCSVNVDTISLAAPGSAAPKLPSLGTLGGWTRSFDSATYGPGYSCPTGTATAVQCTAATPIMHAGLLDKAGWNLLDDTQSAQWTRQGWVEPRPANGDVQDGYLFVFGHDYQRALSELAHLTGPTPLLPESTFGVWYSDFYPYTTADYENTLIPDFRSNHVPLDTLSVDTDWKSPNQWDGWEWNSALFPDPQSFLDYAKKQGIHVTLNIHSSISTSDPELAEAEAIAGDDLATVSGCNSGGSCDVWDWSNVAQAESNFALQQPYESEGTSFWWLDWCCDNSSVSMAGLTPDDWIDHLYAQEMVNKGERGFVLGRIGTSYQNPDVVSPAEAWSAHTSAIHFTGDTWGTWNTLALEAQLSADEATIGEPYVSDDIGSFLGPPPGGPQDTSDLYARWVQLGAFQPVLRLHSNAGNRLPWQYPQPSDDIAASFLRLREALVPYTYTLAAQAHQTGLPMTSPLYLDYPGQPGAYDHSEEYLYGPDMLVAPVTTPGNVASERVWFPPGRWEDWFTGATFTGPSTHTLQVPLDRMSVFVKAGGIVPEQPAMEHVGARPVDPLTLRVFSGGDGQFTLYQDKGTGLGYEHGQYSDTSIRTVGSSRVSTVKIDPAQGSYPGMPSSRAYALQLVDTSRPTAVLLDGRRLAQVPAKGNDGWWYDAAARTIDVAVPETSVHQAVTVAEIGGSAIARSEPAAVDLTISPAAPLSVSPGQASTVTTSEANDGPGAVRNVRVTLTAPTGWQVTPASGSAASIAKGASATQTWTVTAPSTATGTQSASLEATATYVSEADGTTQTVTAQQQTPPAAPPLPPPTITSVAPTSGGVGTVETITGTNFGATEGSSYVLLFVPGISWGAPYDGAKLDILSWSNTSISFALPAPSGSGGEYHIAPGETAEAVVGVAGVTSNAEPITITSSVTTPPNAPVITSLSPTSGAAGTTITVTGQNFGDSQVSNLSDFLTLTDSSGATYGPPFGATGSLDITNWTNTSITFVLPAGAAAGAATISVTTNNFASNNGSLTITASSASAARSGERRA